ncbi:MAG: D-hexose-6-phosphate mutarotase [Candidatus Korobacteraceae bacterium]
MRTDAFIADLNRRFGIPGIAEVAAGNGGLPKIAITSRVATGEIYLHGAHVTAWRPVGAEEVFFVSSQSRWENGKAIRGGIPICFPWFGDKADDPKAPAHGFVRTKSWQLDSIVGTGSTVAVTMSTASDVSTKPWWPADFLLKFCAIFGSELVLELTVTNTGSSSVRFEEALHSYHNVGDVRTARINGLDSVHYLDKTDEYREKVQTGDVTITAETDRVYLDTQSKVELLDPVLQRRTNVQKENSLTTVIWNPWEKKANSMSDLGEGEWTRMLCVETSNVLGYAVEVAPGQQHVMRAVLSVNEQPE